MPAAEIALVARARGLATHLLSRAALDILADADGIDAFGRSLSRVGARIDPLAEGGGVFAVERAAEQSSSRHFWTLYRWQQRQPGILHVCAAHQDRRSLRALIRGAVQGAPPAERLEGLLPTPSLPPAVLHTLAHQASAASLVQQLVVRGHAGARLLEPLVAPSQPDLLGVDRALLRAFAERAAQSAAHADQPLREFVGSVIDLGNVQTALVAAGEPRDAEAVDLFVTGGRSLPVDAFAAAVGAGSAQQALMVLSRTLARSPLASLLPEAASDAVDLDRRFLIATISWLTRLCRLEPLSSAPVLRVLLLIEAQTRDLRTAAWGAALGAPAAVRRQHLVTPP
jgi:vacuolar-type H+-ATPase subunit C/Vma6